MSRGAKFEEKNVRADQAAVRELVEDHKSNATPTLVAAGRVIIGFRPEDYEDALRVASQ